MAPLVPDWKPAPRSLDLASGEVHVWRCSLHQSEERRRLLLQALCAEEKQRAERFYFEHHRRQWTTARGFLRAVLARYLDLAPADIRFSYQELGKPALADDLNALSLHFNLSHSADGAVLAITRDLPLGVDLEQVRPMENMLDLARRYFAPREAEELAGVAEHEKARAFFNCWTRKEAILKACGKGLAWPLDRFVVSFRPEEPARVLEVTAQPGEAERWSLHALAPWPDYVGCVALQGPPQPLTCWDFG